MLTGFTNFVLNENQNKINDVLELVLNDIGQLQPTDKKSVANDNIYKRIVGRLQRVHNDSYDKLKPDLKDKIRSYGVQLAIHLDPKAKKDMPVPIDQVSQGLKTTIEKIVKTKKPKEVQTPVPPSPQQAGGPPDASLAPTNQPLTTGASDEDKSPIPEAPIQQGGANGSWQG
jgi:hypothetical protein